MRRIFTLFFMAIAFANCNDLDADNEAQVTIQFTHNWDGFVVDDTTFNSFQFQTANGENVSIERLRYVVSQLELVGNRNNNVLTQDYNLVDVGNGTGLQLSSSNVITGDYQLRFRFGLADADNQDGVYQDLNVASFNVPTMLGGGYHYMQFDGKYKDANNQDANFNYHVIRAANVSNPSSPVFLDTSFTVDLGTITIRNDAVIEVEMNVAEWFVNPNTWDLNVLNTVLMPNFNAQLLMSQNGKSVFSLGPVTQ
ncbi:MAG: hypothetical protein CMB99_09205 [Flavobacteriaceae bacterium]|nr:hypothetical protein [Flavobacteriaceae bacterium]|tara:strand:+ start:496215 stop:496973 length:759 start_codon:yes stop_codon:yes gene_type:complete